MGWWVCPRLKCCVCLPAHPLAVSPGVQCLAHGSAALCRQVPRSCWKQSAAAPERGRTASLLAAGTGICALGQAVQPEPCAAWGAGQAVSESLALLFRDLAGGWSHPRADQLWDVGWEYLTVLQLWGVLSKEPCMGPACSKPEQPVLGTPACCSRGDSWRGTVGGWSRAESLVPLSSRV